MSSMTYGWYTNLGYPHLSALVIPGSPSSYPTTELHVGRLTLHACSSEGSGSPSGWDECGMAGVSGGGAAAAAVEPSRRSSGASRRDVEAARFGGESGLLLATPDAGRQEAGGTRRKRCGRQLR
jgi:hypothetical protein